MTLTPEQVARTAQDIETAERYASAYDCDDRTGIITDVLNAFYAGIRYERKRAQLESVQTRPCFSKFATLEEYKAAVRAYEAQP